MDATSLFDVPHGDGSIFADNLTICSADRLLSTCYRHLEAEKYLQKPEVASTLFSHDLLNLSILVESIVCHDAIFVNADFIDRWNSDVEENTLRPLRSVITPIMWPHELRLEIENALSRTIGSMKTDPGLSKFAEIMFRDSHNAFRYSRTMIERDLFLPYEEGSHAWGTPFYIAMGTAFYLTSSQALGVPYKPSVLRAAMLDDVLWEDYRSRSFNASEIAVSLLEKSRETVAKEYFERIMELNLVELQFPCILSAVLRESESPADIIRVAMQIRDSKETRAFRNWSQKMTTTMQDGDLSKLGELVKELNDVVSDTNKSLGLTTNDGISVKLGWGPVSVGSSFSLPRILNKPIYLRRHLWFLHNMYRGMLTMARISDHVKRVLVSPLPAWFQSLIPHTFDFKGKLQLSEVDGRLILPRYPYGFNDDESR
jgi:hypothetical protein